MPSLRPSILIALGLGLSLTGGCGTLRVDNHTVVHPNGSCVREIQLVATGAFADVLASEPYPLTRWHWESHRQNGEYHLRIWQNFPSVKAASVETSRSVHISAADDAVPTSTLTLETARYWFVTYRTFVEAYPGAAGESEESWSDLSDGTVAMTSQVSLPGKIIDSNADHVDENTAYWRLPAHDLTQPRRLRAVARRIEPFAIAVAVLIVIALGCALFRARAVHLARRRHVYNHMRQLYGEWDLPWDQEAQAEAPSSRPPAAASRPRTFALFMTLVVVLAVAVGLVTRAIHLAGPKLGDQMLAQDGSDMVWVPPGQFTMGTTDVEAQHAVEVLAADPTWVLDEQPAHPVRIPRGFWLGKCEVTNEEFARFLNDYGKNRDHADHALVALEHEHSAIGWDHGSYTVKTGREQRPVVSVWWEGARRYAEYYGLRLPTEAEWEYAARGPQNLRYPWGDEWDRNMVSKPYSSASGELHIARVGSVPSNASWCGVLDMAGSVWEWCADWYAPDYYATSPPEDPLGPGLAKDRVMRGGWRGDCPAYCRSSYRESDIAESRGLLIHGFRVARDP